MGPVMEVIMRRAARIAIALSVVFLALLVTPVRAWAASRALLSQISINGRTYGETNLPTGLSWDSSQRVLTLNNFTGQSISVATYNQPRELAIRLVGTNTLTLNRSDDSFSVVSNSYDTDGRNAERSIRFMGSGSLAVNGTQGHGDMYVRGIDCGGDIILEGSCTVGVNVNHTYPTASTTMSYGVWGMRSDEGNVIVQGDATLNVSCRTTAKNSPRGACILFKGNGSLQMSSSRSVYLDGSGAGPSLDGIYTTVTKPLSITVNGGNQVVTIRSGNPFQNKRNYKGSYGDVAGFYRSYSGSGATTQCVWRRRVAITNYFTDPTSVTYDGNEHKAISFKPGPVSGTDYNISYPTGDYVNVGTKKIQINATNADTSPYGGEATVQFSITPANISGASVDEMLSQHIASGGAATPKPSVWFNGKKLAENTDYTITYAGNTYENLNATLTLQGKGNFTGSKTIYFSVKVDGTPTPPPTVSTDIYRMYNSKTSEHLYTTSATEYGMCGIGGYADWRAEGVAWRAPVKDAEGAKPVYRLYNLKSGDHHYTTSEGEKGSLLASGDWRDEGIAFYSGGEVEVYRVYNGKLRRGQHHYTTSAGERDALVANHGWRDEGVGFYAVSK